MKNIERGFQWKIQVKNEYCKLILKSEATKFTAETIVQSEGNYYLTLTVAETTSLTAGEYTFQLIDNTCILEAGKMKVIQNLSLVGDQESIKSQTEVILQAIEAQLAGVATQAQASISVGDKSISYMSLQQLLKAKEYFESKLAKQQGKYQKNNEAKIKYIWSML